MALSLKDLQEELLRRARQAQSNLVGNVRAIANPQTRDNWFAGNQATQYGYTQAKSFAKPMQTMGRGVGQAIVAPMNALYNRQNAQTDRMLQDTLNRRASRLTKQGDFNASRIASQQAARLGERSANSQQSFGQGLRDARNQIIAGGIGTGLTLYGAKGAGLKNLLGNTAITGGLGYALPRVFGASHQEAMDSSAQSAGQALQFRGTNKLSDKYFTNPILSNLNKAGISPGNLPVRVGFGAGVNALANMGEDEVLTRANEGRAPTGVERAVSGTIGAFMGGGSQAIQARQYLKQLTKDRDAVQKALTQPNRAKSRLKPKDVINEFRQQYTEPIFSFKRNFDLKTAQAIESVKETFDKTGKIHPEDVQLLKDTWRKYNKSPKASIILSTQDMLEDLWRHSRSTLDQGGFARLGPDQPTKGVEGATIRNVDQLGQNHRTPQSRMAGQGVASTQISNLSTTKQQPTLGSLTTSASSSNNQLLRLPSGNIVPLLPEGTMRVKTANQARVYLKKNPGRSVIVEPTHTRGKGVITSQPGQPFVVKTADQARKIKQQYPQAQVVIQPTTLKAGTKPLDVPVYNAPQLTAGTQIVTNRRQALKALKKPGMRVQVNNPLPPGNNPLITRPQGVNPDSSLGDIEKVVYGSSTPETTQLGGTKSGAGKLSDMFRDLQDAGSEVVGDMVQSPNAVIRNTGRLLQGFAGGLGKSQEHVTRKGQYAGGIDYATKIAGDTQKYVYDKVGSDSKTLERIWSVLDPELSGTTLKETDLTPQEREVVSFLRQTSDFINDTNFKNGFISEEKWLANKGGKYMARAYEPIDYPPEVADFITQQRTKFDLNPFKRREEIDDWKQANAIKDPAYLMAKRLQQTLFNDEVRKMSGWMLNTDMVSDTARPGFVQVSDSKVYGDLAGKYVRKDALEDIRGFFFTYDVAQQAYDLLRWYDRNPVRQTQKKILTIFNPAVRLGNKAGNYVFAWLNGINPVTFTQNKAWASSALKNNDPLTRRMIKDGLLGTDLTKGDIVAKSQELQKGVTDPGILKKIHDTAVSRYGEADDIAKVSAMKTWLDRGYSYQEAARRVYNGFQNYRTVGWLYDVGSKLPLLGNPFVRFKGDLGRIMKNAVIDHPFRTAGTLIAWKLFTDVMSHASGETPEDRKTRESRLGASRIPFTNISLAVQTPWGEINARRMIGIYANNMAGESSTYNDIRDFSPIENPLDKVSYTNDPTLGPIASLAMDTDFRGKSIKDPNANKYSGSLATQEEQRKNQAKFAQRAYTPTVINSIEDYVSSVKGEKDYYGRTRTPAQALLTAYPGIKLEQYGPEQAQAAREKELSYQNYKQDSIKKNISTIQNQMLKGEITPEQAEKRIAEQQSQLITSPELSGVGAGLTPQKAFEKKRDLGLSVTDDEATAYYMREIPAKSDSKYKNAIREDKIFSRISDINNSDSLPEAQKQKVIEKLAKEAGYSKEDYEYYQIAKNDNDIKTLFVEEEASKFTNNKELLEYLAQGRKKVRGSQLVSNGVLDNLYDDELISKEELNYLKSLTWDDGEKKVKVKKSSKKPKNHNITIKTPETKIVWKSISNRQPTVLNLKRGQRAGTKIAGLNPNIKV